jgi:hypothetical protein
MNEVKGYKVTVAYTQSGEPIVEEVMACSMKFAVKDWFCISFFDVNGRMVKEYFKEIVSVTPIYSEQE